MNAAQGNSYIKSQQSQLLNDSQVKRDSQELSSWERGTQRACESTNPFRKKKKEYDLLIKRASGDFLDIFKSIKSPKLSLISKNSATVKSSEIENPLNETSLNKSSHRGLKEREKDNSKRMSIENEVERSTHQRFNPCHQITEAMGFINPYSKQNEKRKSAVTGCEVSTKFRIVRDPEKKRTVITALRKPFDDFSSKHFKRRSILRNNFLRSENFLKNLTKTELAPCPALRKTSIPNSNIISVADSAEGRLQAPRKTICDVIMEKKPVLWMKQSSQKSSGFRLRLGSILLTKKKEMDPLTLSKIVSKSEEKTEYWKTIRILKILDFILISLVIGNIILCLLDNEVYYSETDKYVSVLIREKNFTQFDDNVISYMMFRPITSTENFFRFVNVILVVCIEILIVLHYFIRVRLLQINGMLSKSEGIVQSGFLRAMFLEMFICIWVYPPFLNHVISGTMLGQEYVYSINSLISVAVIFKSYAVLRGYAYFSPWTSSTANSLCYECNVSGGIHFAIKADLKKRPCYMLTIMLVSCVIVLAMTLRTFEYYVIDQSGFFIDKATSADDTPSSSTNILTFSPFQSFSTCAWLVIVTMTTVGYGEFVPKSHFGRSIGVASCIIGLFLVSLIVVSLAIISQFSEEEKKAYSLIKKVTADTSAVNKAHDVIIAFFRFRKIAVDNEKHKLTERLIKITILKQAVLLFKKDLKFASSMSIPQDKMYKIIGQAFKKDFEKLNQTIWRLDELDKTFSRINQEQIEFSNTMKKIESRQERIGMFLIELNNEQFKKSMRVYKKAYLENGGAGENESVENTSDNDQSSKFRLKSSRSNVI